VISCHETPEKAFHGLFTPEKSATFGWLQGAPPFSQSGRNIKKAIFGKKQIDVDFPCGLLRRLAIAGSTGHGGSVE